MAVGPRRRAPAVDPLTTMPNPHLGQHDAREIAADAMSIAAAICIYSNDNITIEAL